MTGIENKIKQLKSENRTGLMGHIVAGFPDIDTSYAAACGIVAGGADFLEIQFPFSDPFADGPVIEAASTHSLKNGITIEECFTLTSKVVENTSIPILIMTYANIIFHYRIDNFIKKAKAIGVTGIIIPDLPPENDEGLLSACRKYNISPILLLAPGNDAMRIHKISQLGNGFVYTVARSGITGKNTDLNETTLQWIDKVKTNSTLPYGVGFGINSPEQVKQLRGRCDLIIVGSYFTKEIGKLFEKKENVFNGLKKHTEYLLS
jgi:tryptophan synthase alpha chain